MEAITFSVFDRGPVIMAKLKEALTLFETQEHLSVNLEVLTWENGWQKLVEFALYHHSPDLSEVGSTWILDLVRMNELRSFREEEVDRLEGEDPFFEVAWKSARTTDAHGNPVVWAIPWLVDPRVVFYRRDLLSKVKIDEAAAFHDAESFDAAIQRLASKVDVPFALPSSRSRRAIHNLASWIWQAGGDFLDPQSQTIIFDRGEALRGIQAYFRLGRFLNREARAYDEQKADYAFWSGKAAVTISGFWILAEPRIPANVRQNLGFSSVLDVSFVGGSHLVIWKHARQVEATLRLLDFLVSQRLIDMLFPDFGLPARLLSWGKPPFNAEPYASFLTVIQQGRAFPAMSLWGLVEKRLADLTPELWDSVMGRSIPEVDAIVQTKIESIAYRLRMALQG